jgi:hypothetical protein
MASKVKAAAGSFERLMLRPRQYDTVREYLLPAFHDKERAVRSTKQGRSDP